MGLQIPGEGRDPFLCERGGLALDLLHLVPGELRWRTQIPVGGVRIIDAITHLEYLEAVLAGGKAFQIQPDRVL